MSVRMAPASVARIRLFRLSRVQGDFTERGHARRLRTAAECRLREGTRQNADFRKLEVISFQGNSSPIVLAAAIYLAALWPIVRLISRLERRIAA